MKGMVFTEFLQLVEDRFGLEVVDRIIEESDLETEGAYTTTGTYDHAELVALVGKLSSATGVDVPTLVRTFGEYLFSRLAVGHPHFLEGIGSTEQMLQQVHDVVHVEVKKLYPTAELPSFVCERSASGKLVMRYESPRGFGDLAEGLIQGCAAHFNETVTIEREDLSGGAGTDIRFTMEFGKAA